MGTYIVWSEDEPEHFHLYRDSDGKKVATLIGKPAEFLRFAEMNDIVLDTQVAKQIQSAA